MGGRKGAYRFWWENLRERDHLGDPGIDGRIILKLIFKKWCERLGLDASGLRKGQVASCCERGNEPLGYIKCEHFLD